MASLQCKGHLCRKPDPVLHAPQHWIPFTPARNAVRKLRGPGHSEVLVRDAAGEVVWGWIFRGRAVCLTAIGITSVERVIRHQGTSVKICTQGKVVLRRPVHDGLNLQSHEHELPRWRGNKKGRATALAGVGNMEYLGLHSCPGSTAQLRERAVQVLSSCIVASSSRPRIIAVGVHRGQNVNVGGVQKVFDPNGVLRDEAADAKGRNTKTSEPSMNSWDLLPGCVADSRCNANRMFEMRDDLQTPRAQKRWMPQPSKFSCYLTSPLLYRLQRSQASLSNISQPAVSSPCMLPTIFTSGMPFVISSFGPI